MSQNKILTAANAELKVTNLYGDKVTSVLEGEPLGTTTGTPTGEIGEKVIVIGQRGSVGQVANVAGNAISTSAGDISNVTAGMRLIVQNLDTDPLFVKYGTGASASSFSFVLPACTATDDGTSPPVVIDSWIGIVSVAGTTPRFTFTAIY